MNYMIEITDTKMSDLLEKLQKADKYINESIQCIKELDDEDGSLNERMGMRYGNREYRERGFDDYRNSGRYSKY